MIEEVEDYKSAIFHHHLFSHLSNVLVSLRKLNGRQEGWKKIYSMLVLPDIVIFSHFNR
jgi:hypothetical protein